MTSVPAPRMLAPIVLRKFATSTLNKMGAKISAHGKTAVFEGVKTLSGAPVYATGYFLESVASPFVWSVCSCVTKMALISETST